MKLSNSKKDGGNNPLGLTQGVSAPVAHPASPTPTCDGAEPNASPQGIPSPTPECASTMSPLDLSSDPASNAAGQADAVVVSTSIDRATRPVDIKKPKEVRTRALQWLQSQGGGGFIKQQYAMYIKTLNDKLQTGGRDLTGNRDFPTTMTKAAEWLMRRESLKKEVGQELASSLLFTTTGEREGDFFDVFKEEGLFDEMLRKVFSPPKFTSLDECFISEVDFNHFVMVALDYLYHNLSEHYVMRDVEGVIHLSKTKLPAHWKQALYDPFDHVDMRNSKFLLPDSVEKTSQSNEMKNWPSKEHIRKILFNGYELRLECNGDQVNALEWLFDDSCVMRQAFSSPVDTKGKLKYKNKTDRPAFIEMLNELFGGIPGEPSSGESASNEGIGEFKKLLSSLNKESIERVVIMSCDGAWAAHAHLGVCEFLRKNRAALGEGFWTAFSKLALTPRDIFQVLAEGNFLQCVEGVHIYEKNNKQSPVSREHVIHAWLGDFTSDAGETKAAKDQVENIFCRVLDVPFTDADKKNARKRALASLQGLLTDDVDFNNASSVIAGYIMTLVELLYSTKAKKSKAKKGQSEQIKACLLALCKACDNEAHAVPQIIDRYQVLCYQVRYKSRVEKLLKLVLHDGANSNYLLEVLNDAGYSRVARRLQEALVSECLKDMLVKVQNINSPIRSDDDVPASLDDDDKKQAYLNLLCQACGEDEVDGETIDQITERAVPRGDACSPTQQNPEACDLKKSPTNMPSPPQVGRNFRLFSQPLQESSPGNVNAAPPPVFPTAQNARVKKLMIVGSRTGLRSDSHQGVGECSMLKSHGPYKPADHAANLHSQQCAMYRQFQYLRMLGESKHPSSQMEVEMAKKVLDFLLDRFDTTMRQAQAQAEKLGSSPTMSLCLSPPLSPTPTP